MTEWIKKLLKKDDLMKASELNGERRKITKEAPKQLQNSYVRNISRTTCWNQKESKYA